MIKAEDEKTRILEDEKTKQKNPRDCSRGRLTSSDPSTKANGYECESTIVVWTAACYRARYRVTCSLRCDRDRSDPVLIARLTVSLRSLVWEIHEAGYRRNTARGNTFPHGIYGNSLEIQGFYSLTRPGESRRRSYLREILSQWLNRQYLYPVKAAWVGR